MKTGDIVKFVVALFPRKRPTDCGMWEWKTGLLLSCDFLGGTGKVLCDGEVLSIDLDSIMSHRDNENDICCF